MNFCNLHKIDLTKIVQVDFPQEQFYSIPERKNQIVLHHTASPSSSVLGDIAWWIQTTQRIATCMIIAGDGKFHQLFRSKYWAYHIGSGSTFLEKASIGVEIDSAGGLRERGGKWYTWYGKTLPESKISFYPEGFRGYEAFESYSERQIKSLYKLLKYWKTEVHPEIPTRYRSTMWGLNDLALNGHAGIWSHVSYRQDKSDCHPQVDLIKMLKYLDYEFNGR